MAKKRGRVIAAEFLLALLICVASVEAMLRLQQYFGPIYDLEMSDVNLDWISSETNHRPLRQQKITLSGKSMYGKFDGYSYLDSYDDNGIKLPVGEETVPGCAKTIPVLFMGDSFIEGYDTRNSVPYQVAQFLKDDHDVCIRYFNAGYMSYSPAIFIPLAKKLLPVVKPEYVVIDIDETDLFDDTFRYDHLIKRDESGRNIAVLPSPHGYNFSLGLIEIRRHFLYLRRLVEKLKLTYFGDGAQPAGDPFKFSRDNAEDARSRYAGELEIFRRNIAELCETLRAALPGSHRIVFIFHPHLQHLTVVPPEKALWSNLISSTIEQVATANDALFFNATAPLAKVFAGQPDKYYWSGDMHFNFLGIEEYSRAVAGYLAGKIGR